MVDPAGIVSVKVSSDVLTVAGSAAKSTCSNVRDPEASKVTREAAGFGVG